MKLFELAADHVVLELGQWPADPWPDGTRDPPGLRVLLVDDDGVTMICPRSAGTRGDLRAGIWRVFKLAGPLDFGLTGILESLLRPLAVAEVPILAASSFATDYVLVPRHRVEDAIIAWGEAGHEVVASGPAERGSDP